MLGDIVTCRLAPGTQILETKAATRYDTSRTGLREAFVDLAAKGFIHLEKNKGAMLAPLDVATVFSVFEARIAMEKTAAALAAVRASAEDTNALKLYRQELQDARLSDDEDGYFAIDKSVHDTIATLSRNPFITSQITTLRAHTARCWHFYKDRGLEEPVDYDGLTTIIDHVISGTPELAAEAMRKHLTTTLNAFQEMLTKQSEVLKWV